MVTYVILSAENKKSSSTFKSAYILDVFFFVSRNMQITVQPKNNARARSGARSSRAARTRKLPQEVKMSCFCGFRKNIRNARS